jgi:hypothetical protein
LADISKINAVLIANIAEIDDVLAANIAKVNGLVFSTAPAFTGLLDTYSGAAAAFSVRRLLSGYTGACMRVREDSGDTETDIGFDSNGDLDTAAIATHCGSANGYVTKWYGQESSGGTGSGNDAENSTQADQPQIYNGSAVITNNGVSALQFDSSGTNPMYFTAVTSSEYVVAVCGIDGNTWNVLLSLDTPTTNRDSSHRVYQNKWRLNGAPPSDWYEESQGDAYINGSQVTGTPATASQQLFLAWNTDPDPLYGFSSISTVKNSRGWYGKIQEIIIYENTNYSDSTNRSGIEGNVNAHYQIGNFGTPTSGLLYDYSGAAAAYSVRQLANTAALAMRIREDGTDTETDIGFDANGDLDTAAIASHCSTNNGFVVTWYDQSGNQNDAAQGTSGSQPQIYNGSAVITENGKPALEFNNDFIANSYSRTVTAQTSYYIGTYSNSGGTTRILTWNSGSDYTRYVALYSPSATAVNSYTDSSDVGVLTTAQNTQYLLNFEHTGSVLTNYANGTASTPYSDASFSHVNTGDSIGNTTQKAYGKCQEVIIYDSDQSSNRSGIETNINSEYLIYQPTDAPTSGLLATYTGAAAAYSVRQLSDKAVIAMRIRRDSDDAETNIGFDANGDLDTTSISDFCSTANGYVVEWADQSTNGNHASQSTGTSQPQIYNGTAVITENGKPALKADSGSNNLGLETTLNPDYQQEAWFFGVLKITGNSIPVATTNNKYFALSQSGGTGGTQSGFTNLTYYSDGTALSSPTSGDLYDELTTQSLLTVDHEWASTDETPFYEVGGYGFFSRNIFQEYIIWQTSQSTNRNGIETNINNYFSIY